MTLIVILIVLSLQRFAGIGENFPRYSWFKSYLHWMQSLFSKTFFWNSIASVIVILFFPLLIVGLLQYLLHGVFFGIFRFILDLVVLWYCLDAYQLRHRLSDYFSAIVKEDQMVTHQHGEKFLRSETAKKHIGGGITGLARAITHEIFLRSDEQLFAVLFWFILLGPVGALAYYLAVTLRDLAGKQNSEFVELLLPAEKVFGILDWPAVRVLGLSYALIGHFVAGFNYVRQNFTHGILQTQEFAIYSGFAALNIEHVDVIHADMEENQQALQLVDRTVFLWIVLVAIFTLGGWL